MLEEVHGYRNAKASHKEVLSSIVLSLSNFSRVEGL